MRATNKYGNGMPSSINTAHRYQNDTLISLYRNSFTYFFTIVFLIIGTLNISGCIAKTTQTKTHQSIEKISTITYPRCSSDRRGQYTIIEVPEISDIGQAPQHFFPLLHKALIDEGHRRDIYRVVPSTTEHDKVALLKIFVNAWTPDLERNSSTGLLSMNLFLIDKVHQCQVAQTTGHGKINYNPTSGFNREEISAIAETAGWFVGMTLMHDP
tara:strand:+ start:228 stop:866 length:639 start_codon:yes stop_codon:yes gene_type:complete